MCEAMKWNHLPLPGGLYDQHPQLLEEFQYIFAKRSEHEAAQRKKEEAERKRKGPGSVAGRRRR